mmetsp:Transcript_2162/g.1949  ORF Transcript_2162/g.1949 Transcript_2162/m.1949 type:complete len:112 (+) Transcript_2162:343-678(+)
MVDSSKLNPNVIHLLKRDLHIKEFEAHSQTNKVKNDKRRTLHKSTRIYNKKKFLITISYLEKFSNLNKVKLAKEGNDQVYEEFELFIEISALCLSNSTEQPMIWEMSLKEC